MPTTAPLSREQALYLRCIRLRDWGGLLFAGPESAAWEMAKKMQPRVAKGGEA